MQFNPDPKKQANDVIFSRELNRCTYPPVTFSNNIIATCPYQKHLGLVLDSKLDFGIHIEQKILSDLTSITVIFCMINQVA